MMDEIELQLCLHIEESAMARSMPPPPLPSHPSSENACRTHDKGRPDQGHAWQGQGTPPFPGVRREKRPAECLEDGIDENGDCVGECNDERGIAFPMSGSLGCEDGSEPGSYLRRPPRKRARTLFLVDGKGGVGIGRDDGGDDVVAFGIDGVVGDLGRTLSSAPLPDIGEDTDTNTQHSDHAFKAMGIQAVDVDEDMDMDGDIRTDVMEPRPSQSPARHTTLHRPQPPFTEFLDGAYMPALLDSLSSPRDEKDHDSHQFLIYEDPEDMDIDGVGYFETTLYLSPEDDKENTEEGVDQQNHHHSREHEQANESNLDPSYDFSLDEHDSYNPGQTTEQHPDHNTTPAHNQSLIRPAGSERQHSQRRPIAPSASPRELEFPDHSSRNDAQQFSFLLSETPPPITTRIDTLGLEYTLPSPTSLSATEVSLRALLPSQTAEADSPTQPENNMRIHPRRHRRVNRYSC